MLIQNWCAIWPALGWGIGLLAHALSTFEWLPFLGRNGSGKRSRSISGAVFDCGLSAHLR